MTAHGIGGLTVVTCGLRPAWPRHFGPACEECLWRTHGPAGSLWCPIHGHVIDLDPTPPLEGIVFLDYTDGHGEAHRLEGLR